MPKSTNSASQSANLVSVTSIGDAAGVPLDGTVINGDGLEAAVQAAVDKMDWLQASDVALVELALEYARQMDTARRAAEFATRTVEHATADLEPAEAKKLIDSMNAAVSSASKALYLGPHLHNTMSRLGGSPIDRKDIKGDAGAGEESPLAAMRRKARGA